MDKDKVYRVRPDTADYQQGYADALSKVRAFIVQKREFNLDQDHIGLANELQKALNLIDVLLHA